jgi:hypothetical protein
VGVSGKISAKGIEVNGQIGKSMARRRYQRGQLSAVDGNWIARWREDVITSNGEVRRVRRKEMIGTLKQYPTKRLAQRELDRRLSEACPVCGMEFSAREMRKHAADSKSSTTVAELRKLHAEGVLPDWKVKRLEKIPGWTW